MHQYKPTTLQQAKQSPQQCGCHNALPATIEHLLALLCCFLAISSDAPDEAVEWLKHSLPAPSAQLL